VCTSWYPDTIEPGRKTGLILSKSPGNARGKIYRLGMCRIPCRIFALQRQSETATRLSLPSSPSSPSFKLFTRQNTETRSAKRMEGGSGWRQSDVRVPKLIFEHKRVAANIGKESTFINKYWYWLCATVADAYKWARERTVWRGYNRLELI